MIPRPQESQQYVNAIDISAGLSATKPAVCVAMRKQRENGYLTPDGRAPALVIKASYNSKATGSGTPFTHTAVFYNYGGGRQTMVVLDGAGDFYIPRSQVNAIIEHLSTIYTLTDKP